MGNISLNALADKLGGVFEHAATPTSTFDKFRLLVAGLEQEDPIVPRLHEHDVAKIHEALKKGDANDPVLQDYTKVLTIRQLVKNLAVSLAGIANKLLQGTIIPVMKEDSEFDKKIADLLPPYLREGWKL